MPNSERVRDQRPFHVVLLDETEAAMLSRERHLLKRREWNARNRGKRRAYMNAYLDPTRVERAVRYRAKRREVRRVERRTPERQERKSVYNRRWTAENRERVRAQNAERQRRYRAASRPSDGPSVLVQKLTPADRTDIAAAYLAGEAVRAIARRYQVAPATVRYHLSRSAEVANA